MTNPQRDQKRRLPSLAVEERPGTCRGDHFDERDGGEPVRADETYTRGREISGHPKRRAAMLRLHSVRGPCVMYGSGGSRRCERMVPTLRRQARLNSLFLPLTPG